MGVIAFVMTDHAINLSHSQAKKTQKFVTVDAILHAWAVVKSLGNFEYNLR